MKCYVCWEGAGHHQNVGRAILADDEAYVHKTHQRISSANSLWINWFELNGGQYILLEGDSGSGYIDMQHLEKLPKLKSQYEIEIGYNVYVGVGIKLSEAAKALMAAQMQDSEEISFYSPATEDAIQASKDTEEGHDVLEDFMEKSEALEKGDNYSYVAGAWKEKLPSQAQKEDRQEAGQEGRQKGKASKGFKSHIGTKRQGAFGQSSLAAPERPPEQLPENPSANIQASYNKILQDRGGNVGLAPLQLENKFHELAQLGEQADQAQDANDNSELDELRGRVAQILTEVRANMKEMEMLREVSPEIYSSIMDMTQAIIDLGRAVLSEDEAEAPEQVQKSEYYKRNLPPGSVITTSPSGTRVAGKIKVRDLDGVDHWISIRSGMIMNAEGLPVSSLRQNTILTGNKNAK